MNTLQNKLWDSFKHHLANITHLEGVRALLEWDQSTYMPEEGASSRAKQMAYLDGLMHDLWCDNNFSTEIKALEAEFTGNDKFHLEQRIVAEAKRQHVIATKIPKELRTEQSQLTSECYHSWIKARSENNFKKVEPFLKRNLEITKQITSYFEGFEHPLDVLMNNFGSEFTVKQIQPIFNELRDALKETLHKITQCPQINRDFLFSYYDEQKQWDFGLQVAHDMGYNFKSGRLDKTHHPFMTKIGAKDYRITTRIDKNCFNQSFFSVVHETGHALYEQNIASNLEETLLATGTSLDMHESQSRFWENLVGRSYEFWQYYFPILQNIFPENLKSVSLSDFYKAINFVEPSPIRVEADEVSYNLHIMIRFELETRLLSGELEICDLPQAWHSLYEKYLGIRSENDADGVLQDVHWYSGSLGGYFHSYTLGNLISAQLFETHLQNHPHVKKSYTTGNFKDTFNWLKDNIHCHGKSKLTSELITGITGQPLSAKPFIHYINTKYSKIYGFNF